MDPGTLSIVAISLGAAVLPAILKVLQSWLNRDQEHKVTLEIEGEKLEIKGDMSEEQVQQIVTLLKKAETESGGNNE